MAKVQHFFLKNAFLPINRVLYPGILLSMQILGLGNFLFSFFPITFVLY